MILSNVYMLLHAYYCTLRFRSIRYVYVSYIRACLAILGPEIHSLHSRFSCEPWVIFLIFTTTHTVIAKYSYK